MEEKKCRNIFSKKFYKTHAKLKSIIAIVTAGILTLAITLSIVAFSVANIYLSKIKRPDGELDIDAPEAAKNIYDNQNIINILLFGLDEKSPKLIGRSDSIMLITINKETKKIKLTSLARDTRVPIEGHGMDKLCHAFVYGWQEKKDISGGAEFAIKTINNAFNLNVSEYITANFWSVENIVNYLGGVDIQLTNAEYKYLNLEKNVDPKTGKQTLNGELALRYSRIRKIDGAVQRDGRQRKVIMALFEKAKKLNPTKYNEFVNLVLKECTTSLSNSKIISLTSWGISNMNLIKFETLSIPTLELDQYGIIDGIWYYTYDLGRASEIIKDFILDN